MTRLAHKLYEMFINIMFGVKVCECVNFVRMFSIVFFFWLMFGWFDVLLHLFRYSTFTETFITFILGVFIYQLFCALFLFCFYFIFIYVICSICWYLYSRLGKFCVQNILVWWEGFSGVNIINNCKHKITSQDEGE